MVPSLPFPASHSVDSMLHKFVHTFTTRRATTSAYMRLDIYVQYRVENNPCSSQQNGV